MTPAQKEAQKKREAYVESLRQQGLLPTERDPSEKTKKPRYIFINFLSILYVCEPGTALVRYEDRRRKKPKKQEEPLQQQQEEVTKETTVVEVEVIEVTINY